MIKTVQCAIKPLYEVQQHASVKLLTLAHYRAMLQHFAVTTNAQKHFTTYMYPCVLG